jgi:hypothetical protein
LRLDEILATLRGKNAEKKVDILNELIGSTEREIVSAVAEYAYLDEPNREVKAAAERVLKAAAEQYTAHLSTYFHLIPWDKANLFEPEQFKQLYDLAAKETRGFQTATPEGIGSCLLKHPSTIAVFRMISGYTLNEIAFVLGSEDEEFLSKDELQRVERIGADITRTLLEKWRRKVPALAAFFVRSLDPNYLSIPAEIDQEKFRLRTGRYDTHDGWRSVATTAKRRVPYYELLYQRYVGGLFRQAMDTSSSIKAEILEDPVSDLLRKAGIPFYKTRFREKIPGWDQAPDFFIPSREAPEVIIEAKVAEDGGTARDKAARIKVLAGIARRKGITLISFVDGKGFTRINDVLMPILAYSKGLVFTLKNRNELLRIPVLRTYLGKAKEN